MDINAGTDPGSNIGPFPTQSGKLSPQGGQHDSFDVSDAHLVLLRQLNDQQRDVWVAWPVKRPIIQFVAVRVIASQSCPPFSEVLADPASSLPEHLLARYSAKDAPPCST